MRNSFLRYALALLAVLLLVLGAVLLYPDRVLESIRPWLERVAADRLDARVDFSRITGSLAGGRLSVENLRIEREGELQIEVRRLEGGFTLPGLLAGRLESLRLLEPSVRITAAAPAAGARPLPAQPPLTVRHLEVSGGRLQLQAAGRIYRAGEIEGAGALGKSAPFHLVARIGAGNGLPLAARGELAWERPLTITLEAFQWGERELLASPLTITFPETGAAASGAFRLDRFDSDQLAIVSAAFGLEQPLPAGWRFTLENPEFRFRLADGLKTALKVPGGSIEGGGISFPLAQVEIGSSPAGMGNGGGREASVWPAPSAGRRGGSPGGGLPAPCSCG